MAFVIYWVVKGLFRSESSATLSSILYAYGLVGKARLTFRTNDAVCIFSYEYLSDTVKSNCAVKFIGESARWADLTIRLVVKANSVSARTATHNTHVTKLVAGNMFVILNK